MPPRNRQQLENLIRRALRSVSENDNSFVWTWWDDFPRTPRPRVHGRDEGLILGFLRPDNLWRDDDGSYETCIDHYEDEWILHEWVFAIACLMLDDGKSPSQVRYNDVKNKICYNRDNVSFQYWRMVNEKWLEGRGRLRYWVEGF
jgi:hypothetical protein